MDKPLNTSQAQPAPTPSQALEGSQRRDRIIGHLILHIIMITAAVVALVPFYWMLSTSMMSLGETINRRWVPQLSYTEDFATVGIVTSSESTSIGLYVPRTAQQDEVLDIAEALPQDARGFGVPVHVNYVTAWNEARFGKYFLNSVIITGLTIIGMLLTSIPASYAFARIDFIGRNLIFSLLLATLMIPESVTMIPNFLVARGEIVPLPLINITGNPALIEWGVSWINRLPALTVPFMANAFSIFLLRQFFAKVPDELWDAARIDGAGHLRFMIQIAVPIARPAIVTVTLLTFINAWNAFLWPLLVTNRDVWRPLMVGLWTFVSEAGPQTHLLMAGSVITILPMIILYFFTQKTFTEGVATSGLKG